MGKDHLDKARVKKDDEFYTLAEDVAKIFDIIPNKQDYHYILPFNDAGGEFMKYCEQNNLDYTTGNKDYKEFNYNIPNALVVSNPPFSKIREIINFYMFYDIKFILVFPMHAVTYSNVFKFWKEWKINYLYSRMEIFKGPDGEKRRGPACHLITNLPIYHFNNKETQNINQELFWIPKRLAKTEYHIINNDEIYIDKMGQDFKDFIYGSKFKKYKKLYFSIRAILTLTFAANRENCFFNNGINLENGKKSFQKIEFRREDEE